MITTYRPPSTTKIHTNIANNKQRHNATNTHTRIFHFTSQPQTKPKCSPTFHSDIFHRPSPNASHSHSNHNQERSAQVIYRNNTREQRQLSLNRTMKEGDGVGLGLKEFNDNNKLELLKGIPNGQTFSRTRKLAELSSNPIVDLSIKDADPKHISYDTYLPSQTFHP